MTKIEYMQENKYLRKGLSNLDQEDLQLFKDIAEGKIDPHSKDCVLRFKQVVYHMQSNMTLWECRGLLKAFKTLQKLPN